MVHILLFYKFLYIPSGARCCLWKTTPRSPGQVRRHISELLTKAKADFREHFGTQLGFVGLGPGFAIYKKYGEIHGLTMVWLLQIEEGNMTLK